MNGSDKCALLINSLLELEEDIVLDHVTKCVQQGKDPFEIIEAAQEAMRQVGLRYEEGRYYISSMMMAGEIFRQVMEIIKPALVENTTGNGSGKILIGTVKGDIHDIGKNIFEILLNAYGFTVTNLGVNVPPDRFVEKAQEIKPDIISLSGLLTVSFGSMKDVVERIRNLEDGTLAQTPFLIGGGTVNEMVCAYVGADYWSTDAMVGVQLCQHIMNEKNQQPAS